MTTARFRTAATLILTAFVAASAPAEADRQRAKPEERNTYIFFYLGDFTTGETAAVLDHASDSFSFGGGTGWRFHRPFTLELDLNMSSTEYDLPEGFARDYGSDDKLELTTLGALGTVKLDHRIGRMSLYVGVGLGLGLVDVSLAAHDVFIPDSLTTQFSPLSQALGGFDVRIGRRSLLGVDYRKLFALRTIRFEGEEVDGGGESVNLIYRFEF